MQDPLARPRVTLGAALTLGSFALIAPAMLFPALALLLVTSRPARSSALVLVGIGTVYALLRIAVPAGAVDETTKAWVVMSSALFVPLAVRRRGAALDAAVLAALVAAGAVLVWFLAHRVDPQSPLRELEVTVRSAYRLMADLSAPEQRGEINAISDGIVGVVVPLAPALTMLIGISGLLSAWRWYHILAAAPAGDPPAPFREFRFSDHLVWLLVAGMAGVVAQLTGDLPARDIWPANLVLLAVALYATRGLAVVRWRTGAWSVPVLLVAVIAVLFLWPFVGAGLFGIGLADTWLDFRRPPAPVPGE